MQKQMSSFRYEIDVLPSEQEGGRKTAPLSAQSSCFVDNIANNSSERQSDEDVSQLRQSARVGDDQYYPGTSFPIGGWIQPCT